MTPKQLEAIIMELEALRMEIRATSLAGLSKTEVSECRRSASRAATKALQALEASGAEAERDAQAEARM